MSSPTDIATSVSQFASSGYLLIPGALNRRAVDALNAAIDRIPSFHGVCSKQRIPTSPYSSSVLTKSPKAWVVRGSWTTESPSSIPRRPTTTAKSSSASASATAATNRFSHPSAVNVAGDAAREPWTADTIAHSIDRSLQRLKTDRIDLVQLHSCSAEVLQKGEAVEAIQRAREAGKVHYIGYSGDGDNALHAIKMGVFATLQTSYNVVDQKARTSVLLAAVKAGVGIIAKRPIANGDTARASVSSSRFPVLSS